MFKKDVFLAILEFYSEKDKMEFELPEKIRTPWEFKLFSSKV